MLEVSDGLLAVAASGPQEREQARLQAVRALRLVASRGDERFERLTRLCARLFDVPMALVSLVEERRQWNVAGCGLSREQIPRNQSFCSVAVEGPDILVVEDARADPRFRSNPLVTGPDHIRFYAGYPVRGPGGHRVGALCLLDREPRRLSPLEIEILRDLGRYLERELSLRDEFDRAADVQRNLLPWRAPDVADHDVAGICLPAREVGGDFYDWYDVGPSAALTVADVMGKGIAAAILAASVRSALRAETRRSDLADVLPGVTAALAEDFERTGRFVTLFHATVSPTGEVRYVDAGHGLAVIVRRDGQVELPWVRGLPLGLMTEETWETGTAQLEPGDLLVAYSDGLLDEFGGTQGSLMRIAATVAGAADAAEAVRRLTERAGAGLGDDVTVVALHRRDGKTRRGGIGD